MTRLGRGRPPGQAGASLHGGRTCAHWTRACARVSVLAAVALAITAMAASVPASSDAGPAGSARVVRHRARSASGRIDEYAGNEIAPRSTTAPAASWRYVTGPGETSRSVKNRMTNRRLEIGSAFVVRRLSRSRREPPEPGRLRPDSRSVSAGPPARTDANAVRPCAKRGRARSGGLEPDRHAVERGVAGDGVEDRGVGDVVDAGARPARRRASSRRRRAPVAEAVRDGDDARAHLVADLERDLDRADPGDDADGAALFEPARGRPRRGAAAPCSGRRPWSAAAVVHPGVVRAQVAAADQGQVEAGLARPPRARRRRPRARPRRRARASGASATCLSSASAGRPAAAAAAGRGRCRAWRA